MNAETYEKLGRVQRSLNAPKNLFNKFGGYAYRSAEGILEAVKPLLSQENAVITLTDEVREIGGRIYVEACASFISNGDMISVKAYAREEENKKGMDAAQVTGSVSSYARKYALNGLLLIDDNKDPDALNDHGKGEAKPAQAVQAKPEAKPAQTKAEVKSDKPVNIERQAEPDRTLNPEEIKATIDWAKKLHPDALEAVMAAWGCSISVVKLSEKKQLIADVKAEAKRLRERDETKKA